MNYPGLFILAFVCMVISFTMGYFTSNHINSNDRRLVVDAIGELLVERDSLAKAHAFSVQREQQYILKIEQDSIKASGLEKCIAVRESKIKTYQQRLSEISKIPINQPDSFLIKRYPQ